MTTTVTLADRRIFGVVSTALIVLSTVVFSLYVRIDHANFWGQIIYLSGLGLGGMISGIHLEYSTQRKFRAWRTGDQSPMTATAVIIIALLIGQAALGLFHAWWAVSWGSDLSSFWLLTHAGLLIAAITAITGAQAAYSK